MIVNEIGALLIGIVIGWLLASTIKQNKMGAFYMACHSDSRRKQFRLYI